MTLQELQAEMNQLPVEDRWRLIQALLVSIQRETVSTHSQAEMSNGTEPNIRNLNEMHPWTKSLMGVLPPDTDTSNTSYIDYLEEKYR